MDGNDVVNDVSVFRGGKVPLKPQFSAPQNDMDTEGSQPAKAPKIHLYPFPEIAHAGDSGAEEFLLRVLWTFRRC